MEEESRSTLWKSIGATAVVVIALAAGGYYWYQRSAEVTTAAPPEAPAPAPSAPAPAATAEPEYLYPIDETESDHATALDQSDAKILDAITHLQGWRASALRLLLPKDLVRHIVATVDGLTGEKLSLQVQGFLQKSSGGQVFCTTANNRGAYIKTTT